MKKERKMNVYVKMGLFMLVSAAVGGAFGFLSGYFMDLNGTAVKNGLSRMVEFMQNMATPFLVLLTILSVFLGERNIRKMKQLYERMRAADEEEYDALDVEEERIGARGTAENVISMALCFIFLSFGYSMEYLESSARGRIWFLVGCVVWLVCYAYDCFWQIRLVKTIQKAHPEMQADPASRKFQKQWLEHCDEAEKEIIYQSCYKTHLMINKLIPYFLLITMLMHLLFQTGAMAVAVVAVLWLAETICYTSSCVKMRKSKIN